MARNSWKQSRLTADGLLVARQRAEARFPGKAPQVITDSLDLVREPVAFVAGDPIPALLRDLQGGGVLPLLAFDCDDSAARIAEWLIERDIPYLTCPATEPALYLHVNRKAREAADRTRQIAASHGLAHVDVPDFCNIAQAIEVTRAFPGRYVEVGVFNGVSGMFALEYMRAAAVERACVFMDVFEGFVYPEAAASADRFWQNTHLNGDPMEAVAERLRACAGPGTTVDVRRHNIISDPFPDDLEPIVVANLDVDMYDAVMAGLTVLAPRMAPGGVLICEDAGHSGQLIGARVAVNRFLRTAVGSSFMPLTMESGQVLLINMQGRR